VITLTPAQAVATWATEQYGCKTLVLDDLTVELQCSDEGEAEEVAVRVGYRLALALDILNINSRQVTIRIRKEMVDTTLLGGRQHEHRDA